MQTEVTKEVQFDAGHRIPTHKSKCRQPHGHRYRLEATFIGEVQPATESSDSGMVMDFGDMKKLMTEQVHDLFDHRFIVFEGDEPMRQALATFEAAGGAKSGVVLANFVPTAENLAIFCFQVLDTALRAGYSSLVGVRLACVQLWETPTSSARVTNTHFSEIENERPNSNGGNPQHHHGNGITGGACHHPGSPRPGCYRAEVLR